MIMYHPESNYPIDVHPSRVEEMKLKGWTESEPSQAEAIETIEEKDNGKS